MDFNNLFELFEKQFLYTSDKKRYKGADKQISKVEIMTFFSVFVNYHSDRCIHVLKNTKLTTDLWRRITSKYDLTKLFLNQDKIYNFI